MSSKAARITSGRVSAFHWAQMGEQSQPVMPRPEAVAPEPAPPADEPDERARLAALERDAFVKGYAQGERTGLEAGAKRSDAVLRRLGETIEELAALRRHMIQQSERQLVQLALALARRIVRREVQADEELLGALARVALERLGESGPATIRLHPDDFARAAFRQVDQWAAAHVTVTADPSVARGGCLVESPFGFVDAGIEAQFQELARVLLDGDGSSAGGGQRG